MFWKDDLVIDCDINKQCSSCAGREAAAMHHLSVCHTVCLYILVCRMADRPTMIHRQTVWQTDRPAEMWTHTDSCCRFNFSFNSVSKTCAVLLNLKLAGKPMQQPAVQIIVIAMSGPAVLQV